MKRWPIILIVLLAGWLYWDLSSGPGERRGAALGGGAEAGDAEPSAAAPGELAGRSDNASGPARPEDPPVGQEAAAEAQTATPVLRMAPGSTATFMAAFESEPRDALWADAEEASIREIFSDEALPDELVQSAACRKTVCRVELRWGREGADGYRRFSQLVGEHWGGQIGIEYPPDSRAERRINLYVLREGFTAADVAE